MARTKLPNYRFERGLRLLRSVPDHFNHGDDPRRDRVDWTLIGRIQNPEATHEGAPFLLTYTNGITNWWCEEKLPQNVRAKILGGVRTLRWGDDEDLPGFIAAHDLRSRDREDFEQGARDAAELFDVFFKIVWRAEYLNDRDENYIPLNVPYAEKGEAQALGASWHGETRKWRVKRDADLSLFGKWISA